LELLAFNATNGLIDRLAAHSQTHTHTPMKTFFSAIHFVHLAEITITLLVLFLMQTPPDDQRH